MALSLQTQKMIRLLNAISRLVSELPPEKISLVATKLGSSNRENAESRLHGVVSTPAGSDAVTELLKGWQETTLVGESVEAMLLAANHTISTVRKQQSIELVWTGPTTPYISTRRTEQALLQVINGAERSLFVTSFVSYDISGVVKAFNAAVERGVSVTMLLEMSKEDGGSLGFDAIGKMRKAVPGAEIFVWRKKSAEFSGGSVHAKVAVADDEICFITSANLTGHALEKNMEAGVLIKNTQFVEPLANHLQLLIATAVVERIT